MGYRSGMDAVEERRREERRGEFLLCWDRIPAVYTIVGLCTFCN
jgi:hypothetical protein